MAGSVPQPEGERKRDFPQGGEFSKSANQERFGESRFLGFLKRKIRDWMAPMERFIF
jgi:hypothetical protein